MGIKRSNSVRMLRRNSSSSSFLGLTLGLDIDQLEIVLSHYVPQYARDGDVLAMARLEAPRVVEQLRGGRRGGSSSLDGSSSDELSNVLMILSSFLSTCTSNVPCALVFDIHTLVGQIREGQRSYESAMSSYLKALWLASCSAEIPTEHLALTQHRIGRLHGLQGDCSQAKKLLLKAVESYQMANVGIDHPIVIDARLAIKEYESHASRSSSSGSPNNSLFWASDDSWSSFGGDRRPILPLISEESELTL